MLQHDDLPEGQHLWIEYRVRMLVPIDRPVEPTPLHPDALFRADVERAVTCDVGSRAWHGTPGECPECGAVTVETKSFPWGKDRYKVDSYCPHCTGGEDVG